jgi:hypothetical protein
LGSKAFPAVIGGLKAFFNSINIISGFRCTVGIAAATQKMQSSTTPGKSTNILSPTDEKSLLHVCMFIALIVRTPSNVNKEWTAEEAKKFIDGSKITTGSGLPALDIPSVVEGFRKWRAILEQCFQMVLTKTAFKVEDKTVPVWRAKLNDLNETAPADCRAAVEKCRQVFLRRRGKSVPTSDYECSSSDGLKRLLGATESIVLPSPPSSSPVVIAEEPASYSFRKPFRFLKSEAAKRDRAAKMINAVAKSGFFPSDLVDGSEYIEREFQKMGLPVERMDEEENDEEEEEEDELPEGPLSVDQLLLLSDAHLAEYSYRHHKVEEVFDGIVRKNAYPYSREQSDNVLHIYDNSLSHLRGSTDLNAVINPVKTKKDLMTMAARATVSLLNMTTEFKAVTYADVQRFVRNRNRRVKEKSKTGRQVNDAFEDAVLQKLIIVLLEQEQVSIRTTMCDDNIVSYTCSSLNYPTEHQSCY